MPQPESSDQLASWFAGHLRAHGWLGHVDRALVACSGGGDSMALLHLLAETCAEPPPELLVVHVDHGVRDGSGADAAFVVQAARTLGLPAEVHRVDLSLEEPGFEVRARSARQRVFRQVAVERGAQAVILAHTLDDQVETVLMNLVRGTGLRGLGGMAPHRSVADLVWLRPLLPVRRALLREYLNWRGITWREDPSNEQLRFTRNRIRARVVPELERAVPGACRNIARAAAILRSEEAWLRAQALDALGQLRCTTPEGHLALDCERLRALPGVQRRRVLREALAQVRGDLQGISFEHVEGIATALLDGPAKARDLPGVRVRARAGKLVLVPLQDRREKTRG